MTVAVVELTPALAEKKHCTAEKKVQKSTDIDFLNTNYFTSYDDAEGLSTNARF